MTLLRDKTPIESELLLDENSNFANTDEGISMYKYMIIKIVIMDENKLNSNDIEKEFKGKYTVEII